MNKDDFLLQSFQKGNNRPRQFIILSSAAEEEEQNNELFGRGHGGMDIPNANDEDEISARRGEVEDESEDKDEPVVVVASLSSSLFESKQHDNNGGSQGVESSEGVESSDVDFGGEMNGFDDELEGSKDMDEDEQVAAMYLSAVNESRHDVSLPFGSPNAATMPSEAVNVDSTPVVYTPPNPTRKQRSTKDARRQNHNDDISPPEDAYNSTYNVPPPQGYHAQNGAPSTGVSKPEVQQLKIQTHGRKTAAASLPHTPRDESANSSSSNNDTLPKPNLQLRKGGEGGNTHHSFTVTSHPVNNKIGIGFTAGKPGNRLQFDCFEPKEGGDELDNGATLGDDAQFLEKGDQLMEFNDVVFEGEEILGMNFNEKMKILKGAIIGSKVVPMTFIRPAVSDKATAPATADKQREPSQEDSGLHVLGLAVAQWLCSLILLHGSAPLCLGSVGL